MVTDRKLSAQTKRKISLAQMGAKNSMYGRRHSRVTVRKLAQANRGKGNPMYGRHHSAEARRKMRLAKLRRSRIPDLRAEYIAACPPAFSLTTAHRDA